MDRASLVNKLADHLAGVASHPLGIAGFMIDDEIGAGRTVVQPGATSPFVFSEADWCSPAVVSHDGAEVRIIAILAKKQRHGALRRLVTAITDAGMTPVIVCPVGPTMPAILAHWGWCKRVIGRGWEQIDEWRPTRSQGDPVAARNERAQTGNRRSQNPSSRNT